MTDTPFDEIPTDCYITPDPVLDVVRLLWPQGIGLDPFHDPESRVGAVRRLDVRITGDSYARDWTEEAPSVRTLFANGPYSGSHPKLTAAKCAETAVAGLPEVLNLCPAAVGSEYWGAHVWPHATAVAFLGRLAFPAGRDIHDREGRLVCPKGVAKGGNRTEIALVYHGAHARAFRTLCQTRGGWPVSVPA